MDGCCSVPWENVDQDDYRRTGVSPRDWLKALPEEMRNRFADKRFQQKSCNSLTIVYKNCAIEARDHLHKAVVMRVVKAMSVYKCDGELVTSALHAIGAIFEVVPELRREIVPESLVILILSMMTSFEKNCGLQVAGFHAFCAVVKSVKTASEQHSFSEAWLIPVIKAGERHRRCSRVRIWCLNSFELLIPDLDPKIGVVRYQIVDLVMQNFRTFNHHTPTLVYGWQVFEKLLVFHKSVCPYFVQVHGLGCLHVIATTLKHSRAIQKSYIQILDILNEASVHYTGISLSWTSILQEVVTAMEAFPRDMDIYPLGVKLCHSALVLRASGRQLLPCISNRLINVLLVAMSCVGPESLDMQARGCEVIYSVCLRCNSTLHHFDVVCNGVDWLLTSVGSFTTSYRLHKAACDILVLVFKYSSAPAMEKMEMGFQIIRFDIKNIDVVLGVLGDLRKIVVNGNSADVLHIEKWFRTIHELMYAHFENFEVHSSVCRLVSDWCLVDGKVIQQVNKDPILTERLSSLL